MSSWSLWILRFDDFTTWYICPSRHAEIKRDKERKKEIFTFSLPLCSCLGRCVPPLFAYFGKEGPLSTCLLRVNEYRPDSCQLCPSTSSVQTGRCRLASTLCSLSALPHLKQHCKGERGEQAVIIRLPGGYCKTQYRLGKCRKVYFFISSGQKNAMFVCIYSMCGTVTPLNVLNIPFRVVISFNQVEFLMERLRESKNS